MTVDAERKALARAVAHNPADRVAWHNLGVALRKAGEFEEARTAISRAMSLGLRGPETLTMWAHLQADRGQFDAAVDAYHEALALGPVTIEAHETLARLLPQIGRGAEALDSYRRALEKAPDQGALWVSALGTAKALGDAGQQLEWARAAEARFGSDTMLTVFAAGALSALGRDGEARDLLAPAVALEPSYGPGQTTLAHILIKTGDVGAAARAALTAAELSPQDQSAWALMTVIWRLLGDSRETWLADYDQLVIPIDLTGLDLLTLAAFLTGRHMTDEHPADQSLRGGSQTRGRLFDSNERLVRELQKMIKSEVDTRLGELPVDNGHPFLGRNRGSLEFAGSWSVRLR